MPEIVTTVIEEICNVLANSIKDICHKKADLHWMKQRLEPVFSRYTDQSELEKIVVHLQNLVPQMISYCQSPGYVSYSQKIREYMDLLAVSPERYRETEKLVKEVWGIINDAVNSVWSHDAKSLDHREQQRHDDLMAENALLKTKLDELQNAVKTLATANEKSMASIPTFTLYCKERHRTFLERDDRNVNALRDIYTRSAKEDFIIELRDDDTHKIYDKSSLAIRLFLKSVKNSNCGIHGLFALYYRRYISPITGNSAIETLRERELWVQGACSVIAQLLSTQNGPFPMQTESFDAYTYVGQQVFSFFFWIPTEELRDFCQNSTVDYELLHFPNFGYRVGELGVDLIFKYVLASYYRCLASLEESEIDQNPKLLLLENYLIGPH